MAKFELTSGKNLVRLGDREFTQWSQPARDPYSFFWWAEGAGFFEGTYSGSCHPKVLNKKLCDNFGSKIPLRFSAAMWNTFVKSNIPQEAMFAFSRLGYKWKQLDPFLVNMAVDHNHLVQQAVQDNTLNLLPLMLRMNKTPQELKGYFGKGLWKTLASTSKTRMLYLSRYISYNPGWADVRTGILKSCRILDAGSSAAVLAAKLAPTIKDFERVQNTVWDTARMAYRLEEEVNPKWSLKRWEEEHERLIKLTNLGKYSDKPFCEVEVFEEDGYTFTLLNNPAAIGTEGQLMGHCVGSYAHLAKSGDYAVFKVEGDKERATLGLRVSHSLALGSYFNYDQCYGKFNKPVSAGLRDAALKTIGKYNESVRHRNERILGGAD